MYAKIVEDGVGVGVGLLMLKIHVCFCGVFFLNQKQGVGSLGGIKLLNFACKNLYEKKIGSGSKTCNLHVLVNTIDVENMFLMCFFLK